MGFPFWRLRAKDPNIRSVLSQRKGIIAAALAAMVAAGVGALHRRPLPPADMEAGCGMAGLLSQRGDYDAAIREYSALMKRTKDAPYVRLGLAGAYMGKGELAKAEEQYRLLLAADPDSPVVLFDLGHCLMLQKRRPAALDPLGRFLALYSNSLPDLSRRAETMMRDAAPPGR
jgi:tetratricopeptide (TPR) repeat protein